MNRQTRILGISGSLRRESYNSAALRAAAVLAPEGAAVETFGLDGIPLFNQVEEMALRNTELTKKNLASSLASIWCWEHRGDHG